MRGKHYNKRVSNAMTINVRNDIASHISETLLIIEMSILELDLFVMKLKNLKSKK